MNQEIKKEIIYKVFGNVNISPNDIFEKYTKRNLPANAEVTRIAPSPTGFMHIGTLYSSLINERIADLSNGIFFVRIEDTDTKRYIEGANELTIKSLKDYGIIADEGVNEKMESFGNYGPYFQSQRKDIYNIFIKYLFEKGLAYLCFCSEKELEEISNKQRELKIRPGYYGQWAKWKNANLELVLEEINKGTPFVIRFNSSGNFENRITIYDTIKGEINMPENDLDIVIRKKDGLPTYHFAHVIDDYLMGTTFVIRGDEWLASTPLHYQLFESFQWNKPKYGHLAPIQKIDNGGKRKLSKRKDPEASMSYYEKEGYPKQAILEYLLNLANSNFEDWRKENPDKSIFEFPFSIEKLSSHTGGALFDFKKLDYISKEIIAKFSAKQLYEKALIRSEKYDNELFILLKNNTEYCIKIFNIERNGQKIRKDIGKWSDIKKEIYYFFDELFFEIKINYQDFFPSIDMKDIETIIKSYVNGYDINDTKEIWFDKIKKIALDNGFADNLKIFKANPNNYKGSIIEITNIIRLFITGKIQSPDLFEISYVLGKDNLINRLSKLK